MQHADLTNVMKKIVILLHSYYKINSGGAEYQAYLLACELIARNYQVHYIYTGEKSETNNDGQLITHGIKKIFSKHFGQSYFLYYRAITEKLTEIEPDIIYNRNLSAFAGIAAKYCSKANCKMIWHIANEPDVNYFRVSKIRTVAFDYLDKKIAEYGVKHAQYIIGQAKYQDELLHKNYDRRCDLVIGNWHPLPKEPDIKSEPVKVVWIANIKPKKNPGLFVELSRHFIGENNVEFVMIGRPSNGEFQRQFVTSVCEIDNLTYCGEQTMDEVNHILEQSDIFVNTSEYEGFANSFIQSWMRGVPVISLNVDPDDLLKEKRLGLHSGTLDQLVEDTKLLIQNKELRNEMGGNAKSYANSNHSLRNIDKVIELIER